MNTYLKIPHILLFFLVDYFKNLKREYQVFVFSDIFEQKDGLESFYRSFSFLSILKRMSGRIFSYWFHVSKIEDKNRILYSVLGFITAFYAVVSLLAISLPENILFSHLEYFQASFKNDLEINVTYYILLLIFQYYLENILYIVIVRFYRQYFLLCLGLYISSNLVTYCGLKSGGYIFDITRLGYSFFLNIMAKVTAITALSFNFDKITLRKENLARLSRLILTPGVAHLLQHILQDNLLYFIQRENTDHNLFIKKVWRKIETVEHIIAELIILISLRTDVQEEMIQAKSFKKDFFRILFLTPIGLLFLLVGDGLEQIALGNIMYILAITFLGALDIIHHLIEQVLIYKRVNILIFVNFVLRIIVSLSLPYFDITVVSYIGTYIMLDIILLIFFFKYIEK